MTGDLGIVVIGRNEGERLVRCLASIGVEHPVVYVDSGSTDGSVAAAQAAGAAVVALDMARPFSAARARNAGEAALPAACRLIQFVDGDCTIFTGWLDAARAALAGDAGLAGVFGRIREAHPEASRYNWLCDVEWSGEPGPAEYFPGIVLLRRDALAQAGGYPEDMIAGEEPDLAIRLRARDWRIARLADDMVRHDAAMYRFGQWWKRAVRSGHADAELAVRNRPTRPNAHDRRLRGTLVWGAAVPGVGLMLVLLGVALRSAPLAMTGGLVLLLPLAQLARITLREALRRPPREALTLATFLMLAKPAQLIGGLRFWWGRVSGRRSGLIEHKRAPR